MNKLIKVFSALLFNAIMGALIHSCWDIIHSGVQLLPPLLLSQQERLRQRGLLTPAFLKKYGLESLSRLCVPTWMLPGL